MQKVFIVLIICVAAMYVLSIKNISFNVSNGFFPNFFKKEVIVIEKETPQPTPPKIFATNGGPYHKKGILTVTARKNITVTFIEDGTNRKSGPYNLAAKKPLKLELNKGNYRAEIFDGSKKNITTLRFFGEFGNLEL